MAVFIKKSILFIIFFIILSTPFFVFNKIMISKIYYKHNFTVKNNTETLILGDSHPMSSLDPELISNSENLSISDELYIFTLSKLKLLLKEDKGIKNIILGYGYHNFSIRYIFFNDDEYEDLFHTYFPILPEEKWFLFSDHKIPFLYNYLKYKYGITFKLFKIEILYLLKSLDNEAYPFWGEHYRSTKTNLDIKIINNKISHYYYNYKSKNELLSLSKIQIKYLKEILDLCKSKDIEVKLYNSPLYIDHYKKIPEYFINSLDSLTRILLEEYKNVNYWDLSRFDLEDLDFGDGDHLNQYGAIKVSTILDSTLKIFDKKSISALDYPQLYAIYRDRFGVDSNSKLNINY